MNSPCASISVVIPVYNSEKSLPFLIDALEKVLPQISTDFEVILVDDFSLDKSWNVICELVRHKEWIQGIKLTRNFGQHNALLCGIRLAQKDIIITMDDDLQNPPEEIPVLLQKLWEGYDVVYGTPKQEKHGFWRNLASQATKIVLQNAMGVDTARHVSGFRAIRSHVTNSFSDFQGPNSSIDVMLTWGTSSFSTVNVRQEPRQFGKSNYGFRRLMAHAINMVIGFSTLPLKLASFIGFGFTMFGIVILVYVVGRYLLFGSPVQGFTFLASTIAVFSGAQLFALGIIGEYLARMYLRSMGQPSYQILTRALYDCSPSNMRPS